jgi:alanine racemase
MVISELDLKLDKQCWYSSSDKPSMCMPVNAYGHHLDLITPLIKNADILAVSGLSEVQKLRQVTSQPILLLSGDASE